MRITLTIPAGPLEVTVTRKQVKRFNLRVRGDGSVALSVPMRTSRAAAERFVTEHAVWIAEHVERVRRRRAQEPAVDGVVPETIPLWGELVPAYALLSGATDAAGVEDLYRAETTDRLARIAPELEARIGARASSWQVRRMRTRWGSCTPARGSIRINSALAAYPPACLAYVVAHELVHLLEPSHNDRFYRLLDQAYPDAAACRDLLKHPARTVAEPTPHEVRVKP